MLNKLMNTYSMTNVNEINIFMNEMRENDSEIRMR